MSDWHDDCFEQYWKSIVETVPSLAPHKTCAKLFYTLGARDGAYNVSMEAAAAHLQKIYGADDGDAN